MDRCKFKFDNYILGLICLVIVCLLPAISPIICFVTATKSAMPYILILISIIGILYEFYIPSKESDKILKRENFYVYIFSFIFLFADIFVFFVRVETDNFRYNWIDYSLIGYIVVPAIVIGIETYRSAKEYYDNIANNNNNGNNAVATGNAVNV